MTAAEPQGVALGSVLVSLLDPVRGGEAALHRWYERDHFYAGCMIGPYFFAGRRFVATRALKDLRYPEHDAVLDDVRRGSYLALYWILGGHHAEAEAWAVRQVHELRDAGRMSPARVQAHAGFCHLVWCASRDADGVPAELALDHPYPGMVMLMVDRAPGVEAAELTDWYRKELLTRLLPGSPAALCLCLQPVPLPEAAPAYVPRPEGIERRSIFLYFVEEDPRECWNALFVGQGAQIAERGLGRVSFAAPFIPTIPGSDRYTDELW